MPSNVEILLINENNINDNKLIEYITSQFNLNSVNTEKEALEILNNSNINLIILNIQSHKIDEINYWKEIFDKYKTFNIPILFVTCSVDDKYIEKLLDLGANDYITLPFKKSEILTRIKMNILVHDYKHNLELRVKEEIEKNKLKEKIMFHQSKLVSIGEMLNIIAHQWRQPLSSINSAIFGLDSILIKRNTMDEEINSRLEEIERQTQYMSKTIEDFSNFLNPNKTKGNHFLKDIVEESYSIMSSKLNDHGINFELNIKNNKVTNCIKGEILQVIIVIINNAVDAFRENKIKNPKIKIDVKDSFICIKDNAGGIKQEKIDDIFLPYYTTKLDKDSLGIGLYIAKTIIEESNKGTLKVHNNEEGACFCINLPN